MSSATVAGISKLIGELMRGQIAVEDFCKRYEEAWNFELDRTGLTRVEARVLKDLFLMVAWYSPFEDERRDVPNYTGNAEVIQAARAAAVALGIWGAPPSDVFADED